MASITLLATALLAGLMASTTLLAATLMFRVLSSACLLVFRRHVAIGERPQERDDGKLLPVVQSKIPHLGCVDVVGHFWRRPSRAGNVPRVVEVNDLLQRLEVAVVAVRLHELPGWPQVDVAQGWDLMLAPLRPPDCLIFAGGLEEEASQAGVNPVRAGRVPLRL